ncbi:unnamed protein product [Rotaria sp. Silwood1]|nr:unnamed protein product [Rotaria sp. Silwood1]
MRQVELDLSKWSVLWVDNNIFDENWENKQHMETAAAKALNLNVHFIPKSTTNSALSFLRSSFGQRLKNQDTFRIVTDMTRYIMKRSCLCIDDRSDSGPKWDSFKSTWGPNPLRQFLGQRFIKDNDIALVLIYDIKGSIAGVQLALPVSMAKTKYYKFDTQKMYNRATVAGIDSYVLTAYFVDPQTICTSGRDEARLKLEGSGTGLWLQNGPDPIRDSVQSPLYENTVNTTKWVLGSCFPSMGVHYWYDNRLDNKCDEIFPVFLLYNKGKLTGFGWGLAGKYDYSKRTESVPYGAVSVQVYENRTNLLGKIFRRYWWIHSYASLLQYSSMESALLTPTNRTLTWKLHYNHSLYDPTKIREDIQQAFDDWARYTELTFRELLTEDEKADFNLAFVSGEHSYGIPFDELGGQISRSFPLEHPHVGHIHFDATKNWSHTYDGVGYNLRLVAAHEIGSSLGLPDSNDQNSIMSSLYQPILSNEMLLKKVSIRILFLLLFKSKLELDQTTKNAQLRSLNSFLFQESSVT